MIEQLDERAPSDRVRSDDPIEFSDQMRFDDPMRLDSQMRSDAPMLASQQSADEEMLMSQSQKVDIDKIYEFNDDEEFEEASDLNCGFKLSGIGKNSQTDHHFLYYSSSEDEEESSPESEMSSSTTLHSPASDSSAECVQEFPNRNYADLNEYVTLKIFKLLSLIDLQQCRLACKKWRILADQIRVQKLALVHFSGKHSWSSEDNFANLQRHPEAIDMRSLDSIRRVLVKPQFRDLAHLILISDYTHSATGASNPQQLELDVSRFAKLKRLELFGTMIYLKEDQKCETLTHLSIEHVTVNLLALFPNLVYLKTNVLTTSPITSPTLEQLEFFNGERDMSLIQGTLHELCPNIKSLSCYMLNAYSLLNVGPLDPREFRLKQLRTIKIFFNSITVHESLIDYVVQTTKSLNIRLEFHVNKHKEKTDLLRWNKFFEHKQIDVYYYAGKEVNLRDFFLLPNYENNTLMRQNLKVDNYLNQINDKVYPYLFNTNGLEYNCRHLESKFNRLLKTIPLISKLTINYPLQQSTFDNFRLYCPFLSHLKISSDQAYRLDLRFIHHLDHLSSLKLINLHLVNTSGIASKVKFSKFLTVLEFKNCSPDADYCLIFKSTIEKAKKNQGTCLGIFINQF